MYNIFKHTLGNADFKWIHSKHRNSNVWDFNHISWFLKKNQVHMFGIVMDLYERIMNMQLFNNYMQWIQKHFKRELISDRFKSISIIMVKPKFCCIFVFFYSITISLFWNITNILHCIKLNQRSKVLYKEELIPLVYWYFLYVFQ